MRAVITFIKERGFTVMIWGMLTAVAGIVAYVVLNTPRFAGTLFPKAAFSLAVIGFVIYFIGRVSVAMQRRRNSSGKRTDIDSEEGQKRE
ncbi:MAG: hypothetical protein LBB56_00935 [Chitinispirillales bacterium]|jgi:hypothetical protein|nr:hypothetical protein [Chitinispirillales bacterium]